VQQRNDPSHVGSVQMHSLPNQSQPPQQQQQPLHQEQRNAPKRYSSLRRSQQEASQHLAEQQQQQQMQQQLHLQQQQQSQIMIQDPHVLMQIAYQQQELQAQLQTMQLGPPTAAGAVPTPPKPHAPPAAAYPQAQAAPYYVTGAEPVPVPVSVPQAPYVNPASAAYLPTTPAAVAYAQAAPSVVPQPTPPPAQAPTATQPAQPYQNYNTVGGTTYFVPPAQTASRPAALPQRRPTNAIPILPPSEKHKGKGGAKEEGISDNIDHIIDNMFVQRPSAFQATGEGAAPGGGSKDEVAATPPATEQNLQPVPATGQE